MCCETLSVLMVVYMQDENARYYRYRYVTDRDEAMSYWVEHDRHSTVFYGHYRTALVRTTHVCLWYCAELETALVDDTIHWPTARSQFTIQPACCWPC